MTCAQCEVFDTELAIRGPAEFESVVEKVRQAVADEVLEYNAAASEEVPVEQPSFLALDLGGPWPDVMQYHFDCPACGARFVLSVETYHGAGGSWRRAELPT